MLQMAISAGNGRLAGLAAWAGGLGALEFVLVREKGLTAGQLLEVCREVKMAVSPGTRVLVAGGRVDVALAAGLDGVHLSAAVGELRVGQVRRLFPTAFVSVSCHAVEEVRRARREEASAVLFAPVFGKWVEGTEVVPGVGLAALAHACRVAGAMPVFALGWRDRRKCGGVRAGRGSRGGRDRIVCGTPIVLRSRNRERLEKAMDAARRSLRRRAKDA